MLVSVIIPTYNYGRFVTEAVDSALSQSYAPIEVIVVDDGSTDDTQERLAHYGNRIRFIHQTNQGLSAARNTGMHAARGDYIALLDSDDAFHPKKVECQVRHLQTHPAIGLVGTASYSDSCIPLLEDTRAPLSRQFCLDEVVIKVPFCPSSVLMTRKCREQVGDFDPCVSGAADRDYWIRSATRVGVSRLEFPLTYYRVHAQSMSQNTALMDSHERMVIAKALAMPELATRPFFRRKVWAYFRYTSGFMYYQGGAHWTAAKALALSLLGYPFPYSREYVRYPFGRVRLLAASLLTPRTRPARAS